ncbi:hypothetical protein RI367_001163 [Sorochytrium milnesiophthora]
MVHAKGLFVTDLETAVVKATKRNSKGPKWKHVTVLLNATWRRDISIAEIGKLLEARLRESSWSVVFKTLTVAHILMDQGSNDRLIGYLATQPNILNLASFRDSSGSRIEQAKNIRAYAMYLEEKVHVYRETKRDFCRTSTVSSPTSVESYGRSTNDAHLPTDVAKSMRTCPVNEAFVKQLGIVVRQLQCLVKARFAPEEIDNAVTLEAFKMLLKDLMRLFHVVNEGVINILEHFTSLPKDVARSGLNLYKQFCTLTAAIDEFLDVARRLPKSYLSGSLPTLKHIPDISASLEQSLNDPGSPSSATVAKAIYAASETKADRPSSPAYGNQQSSGSPTGQAKQMPALIDFFDSIEQNNTTQLNAWSQQQQQQQQQGFSAFDPFGSATSPAPSVQQHMTGMPQQTPPAFDPFASTFTQQPVQQQFTGVQQHFTGMQQQNFTGVQQHYTGAAQQQFGAIQPQPTGAFQAQAFTGQQQFGSTLQRAGGLGLAAQPTGNSTMGYGGPVMNQYTGVAAHTTGFNSNSSPFNAGMSSLAPQQTGMFSGPGMAPSPQLTAYAAPSTNASSLIGSPQPPNSLNPFASTTSAMPNGQFGGQQQQAPSSFDPFGNVQSASQRMDLLGAQNTLATQATGGGMLQPAMTGGYGMQQQQQPSFSSNPFAAMTPMTTGVAANYTTTAANQGSSSLANRMGSNPFANLDPLQGANQQPKTGGFVGTQPTGQNFQRPSGGEVLF